MVWIIKDYFVLKSDCHTRLKKIRLFVIYWIEMNRIQRLLGIAALGVLGYTSIVCGPETCYRGKVIDKGALLKYGTGGSDPVGYSFILRMKNDPDNNTYSIIIRSEPGDNYEGSAVRSLASSVQEGSTVTFCYNYPPNNGVFKIRASTIAVTNK